MGDLSAELLVLHHKNFQFLDVVYENLSETDWEHVLGGFVGTVTNVGHLVHSLETPADPVVNSLRFTPVALDLTIPITLMAGEGLCALLDDLGVGGWCDSHRLIELTN